MMIERRRQELALLEAKCGALEVGPHLKWLIVKHWPLPAGWNKDETAVLVVVPPGYPTTPPDNFYADPDLRLANGRQPANSAPNHTPIDERRWLWFSYHVDGAASWQPHAELLEGHNLLTFFDGIAKRFEEAV